MSLSLLFFLIVHTYHIHSLCVYVILSCLPPPLECQLHVGRACYLSSSQLCPIPASLPGHRPHYFSLHTPGCTSHCPSVPLPPRAATSCLTAPANHVQGPLNYTPLSLCPSPGSRFQPSLPWPQSASQTTLCPITCWGNPLTQLCPRHLPGDTACLHLMHYPLCVAPSS